MTKRDELAQRARAKALESFTEYFVQNYPGPNTIIHNPNRHAPKIFRAAEYAIEAAQKEIAPLLDVRGEPVAQIAGWFTRDAPGQANAEGET